MTPVEYYQVEALCPDTISPVMLTWKLAAFVGSPFGVYRVVRVEDRKEMAVFSDRPAAQKLAADLNQRLHEIHIREREQEDME